MLAWLLARPVLTHALIAAAMTAVIFGVLRLADAPWPGPIAAAIVTTWFAAREAGQREHALKASGYSPVLAWFGAYTGVSWSRGNWGQFLAPAGAAVAVAAGLWALTG